jgi:intracellular sulfur oxidation DsrE/DsrF family protein
MLVSVIKEGINMHADSTHSRRSVFRLFIGLTALLTGLCLAHAGPADSDLFGEPAHKVVYQLNKADPDYINHVLFSVGAMLRMHEDNIHIVVTMIGPGIHLVGKHPRRPVPEELRQRAESLSMYGVEFHACGNTMKSLGWTEKDLLDYATVVEVGANDLMELQEQGYAYISW